VPEPTASDAGEPTRPDERPAVDAVQRLSTLTSRSPATPLFGRRDPAAGTEPSAGLAAAMASAAPAPTASAWVAPASPFEATASADESAPQTAPAAPTTGLPSLGRLSRVEASALWPDDERMTAWLGAQSEVLAEAIGVRLSGVAVSATGRLIGVAGDGDPFTAICEVGPSTAAGLASLLAAASVQEAGTVAWIAGEPDETHGATLSWLNRSTTPSFYMVRVAGIRIGESASAPTFEVVVRPARSTDRGMAVSPTTVPSAPPATAPTPTDGRRAEDHEAAG
jgi:hypothetical protein